MKKRTNLGLAKKAFKELGYKYKKLDPAHSKAVYVEKGEKMFICGLKRTFGIYPTNPKFAEYLVDDKESTKRILKRFGFRVIKGKKFFTFPAKKANGPKRSLASAKEYAEKIGYPVFVKPNLGSRGRNASIIFNKTQLTSYIQEIRARSKKDRKESLDSFLIEKFTQRPEYRIFIVNGKVQFTYKKERVAVVGDGESTIESLISNLPASINEKATLFLKLKKIKTNTVLKKGEFLDLQPTANITSGAKIINYEENVSKEVRRWAKKLYKSTGLGVMGVDIFTKNGINDPEGFIIIEVNSCPSLVGIYNLGHKEKVLEIWEEILESYFS